MSLDLLDPLTLPDVEIEDLPETAEAEPFAPQKTGPFYRFRLLTATGQTLSDEVLMHDPLRNNPVVLLTYEEMTPKEKILTQQTLQKLFPHHLLWIAPAAAVFATVQQPGMYRRYRLEQLYGLEGVVHGPEGTPLEGQSFRVWWKTINPWTHCPIVIYHDPVEMEDDVERKKLQSRMLEQLGEAFRISASLRRFPIANAAFGFAQVKDDRSGAVARQQSLIGAQTTPTARPTGGKSGRRRM